MSIQQITTEILQLSKSDRALLAKTIWESLEDPFKFSTDLTEEDAVKLARKRDKEIEQGIVTPFSHEELMQSLRTCRRTSRCFPCKTCPPGGSTCHSSFHTAIQNTRSPSHCPLLAFRLFLTCCAHFD